MGFAAFHSPGLVVEVSQIEVHERDEPGLLVGLFDSARLASEDRTEIGLAAFEADSAARGDGDGLVVEQIAAPRFPPRVRSNYGPEEYSGRRRVTARHRD